MTDPLTAGIIIFVISGIGFIAYHDPKLFKKSELPILLVLLSILVTMTIWGVATKVITSNISSIPLLQLDEHKSVLTEIYAVLKPHQILDGNISLILIGMFFYMVVLGYISKHRSEIIDEKK